METDAGSETGQPGESDGCLIVEVWVRQQSRMLLQVSGRLLGPSIFEWGSPRSGTYLDIHCMFTLLSLPDDLGILVCLHRYFFANQLISKSLFR